MKKVVTLVLVIVLLAGLLSGCSGYGGLKVSLDKKDALEPSLFLTNQCDITYDGEGTGSSPWFKVNTGYANDPHVNFNFKQYLQLTGRGSVSSDTYKYIVLKIKTKNCNDNSFMLFANTGDMMSPDPNIFRSAFYDNTSSDWNYVMFDFSDSGLTGDYSYFRFDFEKTATSVGESCCVAEMIFLKTEGEALKFISTKSAMDRSLTDDEKKTVDGLLSKYKVRAPAEFTDYKRKTAAKEDSGLTLKFNHSFTRIAQEDTGAGGTDTYCMYLAKNELEACQLVLTAKEARDGLTVEVSDFTFENGSETLKTQGYDGTYFEVEGEHVIDPIPPLSGSFGVEKNTSKSLVIKTGTQTDSKPGAYKATVNVKNSSGEVVKTADIFAYVWDFVLPEETSCRTLMDLGWYGIYSYHECYEGDDGVLYKMYYDLLLENRVCAYNIPYNTNDGLFTDERVLPYLDNPRVRAFQAVGWKTDLNETNVKNAYSFLSQKPEWLDKAYFYPIDEPLTKSMLDDVNRYGQLLKENFPGYKLITPMHYTEDLSGDGTVDYFEYVKDSVTAWCPHNFFFSTWKDYMSNPKTYIGITPLIEKKLGEFPDRIKKEQQEGDEVWWYVTRVPNMPEATLLINCDAIGSRELFWLQKLYGIDHFLYYAVNDWSFKEYNYGVDPKFEIVNGNVKSYGNGVLVYCGKPYGINGPVESMRLELVRDGIEDFEYLTMLESMIGKESTDLIVRTVARSLTDWNKDTEAFSDLRIKLGTMIEAMAGSSAS